jgi:hypothetical protein
MPLPYGEGASKKHPKLAKLTVLRLCNFLSGPMGVTQKHFKNKTKRFIFNNFLARIF